jgi:hypothetical protein
MDACHHAILDYEREAEMRYLRAARIRTDVVHGAQHDDRTNVAFDLCVSRDHRLRECDHDVTRQRGLILSACAHHLVSLDGGRHSWVYSTGLYTIGSRDVVVDHYFRGLRIIEDAHAKGTKKSFGRMVQVWKYIQEVVINATIHRGRTLHKAGACKNATQMVDIVRAAGPPKQLYFLQWSESGQSPTLGTPLHACLRVAPLGVCLRALEMRWQLPTATISACLQFEYDRPTSHSSSSCSAEELVKGLLGAHNAHFGSQLTGDVDRLAKVGQFRLANRSHAWQRRTDGYEQATR